jgi:rare lipoprotein A
MMNPTRLVLLLSLSALLSLAGCAYMPYGEAQHVPSEAPQAQSSQSSAERQDRPRVVYKKLPGEVDPKIQPYSVMGKTYWPIQSALGYREEGVASWYGMDFHGKKTATGETYDMFSVSAAHKTLPLGSKVRVTNLQNGRELELTVNDRGPFVDGRIIDLSYASARLLGMADNGVARVRVEGVEDNPVLARRSFTGTAVASADAPPRKAKAAKVVERTIVEEPAKPTRAQASAKSVTRRATPEKAAPEKAVPVQTAVADASESGRYMVQVGAFSHDENARKVKERLVHSGFKHAVVMRAVRGGRELSVVLAGAFEQREQAEAALESLREEFPTSFINTGA